MTDPLTEIREAMEKATKGPWRYEPGGGRAYPCIRGSDSIHMSGRDWDGPDGRYSSRSFSDRVCVLHGSIDDSPEFRATVDLILLLRNHASALVAVAEAARALRRRQDLIESGLPVERFAHERAALADDYIALDAALAALGGGK